MFDPNQIDPARLIEAQQDEIARAVREKTMVVAQANGAIAALEEVTNERDELARQVKELQANLEGLRRSIEHSNGEGEVVEGTVVE